MSLQQYLDDIQFDYDCITYEIYCESLDLIMNDKLNENFFEYVKTLNLSREFVRVFNDLKFNLIKISKEFKIGIPELVNSFKHKDIYAILKSFKFNISLVFRALAEVTNLVREGLLVVFRELYKTKAIQKVRMGALKVDDLINKYPILKKVTGIVIAGLLLYIWLNMTFIGNFDYDFNFNDTVDALHGSFSLADLFVSPEGLMLITLFGTGSVFGLSIPWLGKSLYNLTAAIIYTVYYKLSKNDKKYKEMIAKFKSKIKMEKIK